MSKGSAKRSAQIRRAVRKHRAQLTAHQRKLQSAVDQYRHRFQLTTHTESDDRWGLLVEAFNDARGALPPHYDLRAERPVSGDDREQWYFDMLETGRQSLKDGKQRLAQNHLLSLLAATLDDKTTATLEIAEECQRLVLDGGILVLPGNVDSFRGGYDWARRQADCAIALANKRRDLVGQAEALLKRGNIERAAVGAIPEANLSHALEFTKAGGRCAELQCLRHPTVAARLTRHQAFIRMFRIFSDSHSFEAGEPLFREASNLATDLGSDHARVETEQEIATLFLSRTDPSTSRDRIRSVDQAEKRIRTAETLHHTARSLVVWDRLNFERARVECSKAQGADTENIQQRFLEAAVKANDVYFVRVWQRWNPRRRLLDCFSYPRSFTFGGLLPYAYAESDMCAYFSRLGRCR